MGQNGLKVLEKITKILKTLNRYGPQEAQDISVYLDMPKRTTYHYLSSMQDLGILEKVDSRYLLGVELVRIGERAKRENVLYPYFEPYLKTIANMTGETVYAGVGRGKYRILLSVEEGPAAVHDYAFPGERRPAHLSAIGKAILAQEDSETVRKRFADHSFKKVQPHSITTVDALLEELERTRELGYAVDDEEYSAGIRSVAAPIDASAHRGGEIGALSLIGPKSRFTPHVVDQYGQVLREATERIEIAIEHQHRETPWARDIELAKDVNFPDGVQLPPEPPGQ